MLASMYYNIPDCLWLDDHYGSSDCGGVPSIGLPMMWFHSPSFVNINILTPNQIYSIDTYLHVMTHWYVFLMMNTTRQLRCFGLGGHLPHLTLKFTVFFFSQLSQAQPRFTTHYLLQNAYVRPTHLRPYPAPPTTPSQLDRKLYKHPLLHPLDHPLCQFSQAQ